MRFSRYVVDNKSHYFASECSRNCVSFAHGYSSNITLRLMNNQAYACKHATAFLASVRLSCPTHYQMEMREIRTLDPLLVKAGALPTELYSHRDKYSYLKVDIFFYNSGSHLLSHTVSSAVPSAAWVLTIVFGMGTGVSPKRIATRNL